MIDSVIASNHHFYVLFFESQKIKTLSSISSIFNNRSQYEIISIKKNRNLDFCHLQLELNKLYGTENVLKLNLSKNKKGGPFYWYDFYIGKIDLNEIRYFYICYPYNRLGKFLENCFHSKSIQTTFYKPKLEKVLAYMQDRSHIGISLMEKNGFNGDITRYSAVVSEAEDKANKINIIGQNPLKSKTFEILNAAEGISIETIALKLKCLQLDIGEIDLSFDRLGNYRFWLKRKAQGSSIPTIPFAFKFLMEIAPLESSEFISSNTLLENE